MSYMGCGVTEGSAMVLQHIAHEVFQQLKQKVQNLSSQLYVPSFLSNFIIIVQPSFRNIFISFSLISLQYHSGLDN